MRLALVVDANVAVKWVLDEPGSAEAAALRGHALAAPDLLWPECASILWRRARMGELTGVQAAERLAALLRARVDVVPGAGLATTALELATALDHPAYDCFYLALAEASGAPLVTADLRLMQRALALPRLARCVVALEGWQRNLLS